MNLITDGVMVIPSNIAVPHLESLFLRSVSQFPDMQLAPGAALVGGGFSALGNPYSFHNPQVRELRKIYIAAVRPVLRTVFPNAVNIENLICRTVYRQAKVAPSAESWHRDAPDNPVDFRNDTICGGWFNTSPDTQYFSCVLGSHIRPEGADIAVGFAPIPKTEHAAMKASSTLVAIPPGHILIFNENIAHQVLGRKFKHKIMRVHMGFAVTARTTPMVQGIETKLKTGAVIPLKSGQFPAMWPKLYFVNWFDKLQAFSDGIQNPLCKTDVVRKGIIHHGIVRRFLPSLQELGVEFEPYGADELALYTKPY